MATLRFLRSATTSRLYHPDATIGTVSCYWNTGNGYKTSTVIPAELDGVGWDKSSTGTFYYVGSGKPDEGPSSPQTASSLIGASYGQVLGKSNWFSQTSNVGTMPYFDVDYYTKTYKCSNCSVYSSRSSTTAAETFLARAITTAKDNSVFKGTPTNGEHWCRSTLTYSLYVKRYHNAKLYKKEGTTTSLLSSSTTGTTTLSDISSDIAADSTVYIFEGSVVTFVDGQGNTLKTQTVEYGGSATPPSNPTRTGYVFDVWSGSYDSVTADTTVTATWKLAQYSLALSMGSNVDYISYSLNGGSAKTTTGTTLTLDYDTKWSAKAVPNTGYTGNSGSGTITGNDSWSGVATEISYTISFNANGGSGSMASETIKYTETKTLNANSFTRTGYDFKGWATSASGSVVYDDKASVKGSSIGTRTLYAVWAAKTYSLAVNLSAGIASVDVDIDGTTTTCTSSTTIAVVYGAKWTVSDAALVAGYKDAVISSPSSGTMGTSNVTVSVTCTAQTYNLTIYPYGAEGGVEVVGDGGVKTGTTRYYRVAGYISQYTKTGYSLVGYFDVDAESGGDLVYDDSGVYVPGKYWSESGTYQGAQDLTCYGRWVKNSYKMTCSVDAASASAGATTDLLSVSGVDKSGMAEYLASVTYTADDDASKSLEFEGWYLNGVKQSSSKTMKVSVPAGDTEYVAKWSLPVKITKSQENSDDTGNTIIIDGTSHAGDSVTVRRVAGSSVAIGSSISKGEFVGWFSSNDISFSKPLEYPQNTTIAVTESIDLVFRISDSAKTYFVAFYNVLHTVVSSDSGAELQSIGPGSSSGTSSSTSASLQSVSAVGSDVGSLTITFDGKYDVINVDEYQTGASAKIGEAVSAGSQGRYFKCTGVQSFTVKAAQGGDAEFRWFRRASLSDNITFDANNVKGSTRVSSESVYSGVVNSDYIYLADYGDFDSYKVTATIGDASLSYMGSVDIESSARSGDSSTVSASVVEGSDITVVAYANNGYKFTAWKDNGSVVSNDARYTFEVNSATTLTAVFEADGYAVYKWEGGTTNKTLRWKSKRYALAKPINPVGMRVDATAYPVKMAVAMFSAPDNSLDFPVEKFVSDDSSAAKTCKLDIASQTARRVKTMRPERYLEVSVEGTGEIDAMFVGASMQEMAI